MTSREAIATSTRDGRGDRNPVTTPKGTIRKPDLFLVGAAKSGTTSMEAYLAAHPEIFMSARSETHHFGRDLTIKYRVEDTEEYLALFSDAGQAVAAGEKSIGYLFSRTASQEILTFNPDAAIVIMLRNPADMAFSLHRQFVRSGNEDIVDFSDALAAQDDRKQGLRIPITAHKPDMLQYLDVVRYAPQVERYFESFGDRVTVILFDDLQADSAAAYRRVLRMVGADERFLPEFTVHNPTVDMPSVALRRQMARFPVAANVGRSLINGQFRRKLRRASAKFQPQPDRKIDPAVRQELLSLLSDDIAQLSSLLSRDLTMWTG